MWWQFALAALAGFVTGSFAAQFKAGGIFDKAIAARDEAVAAREKSARLLDEAAEKLEAAKQEKLSLLTALQEQDRKHEEHAERMTAQYVQIMGRSVRR